MEILIRPSRVCGRYRKSSCGVIASQPQAGCGPDINRRVCRTHVPYAFGCNPYPPALILPSGELSPKVTERALQARSNGNSKQRESQASLSGGCAASSPKGRAKYRSQRTAAVVHTAVAVNYLMNTPCQPGAFPCSGQYCEIAAPCSARLAMTSQETCRVWGGAPEEGRASAFPD